MLDTVSVKFWGVRGSYPTPGAETVRFGGNTSCVEVNVAGRTIILDAGTGIIPLGRELVRRSHLMGTPVDITLLFSHLHHDHTQGFPFFVPAYDKTTQLKLYGPDFLEQDLEQALARTMTSPAFPVAWGATDASKSVQCIHEGQSLLIGSTGEHLVVHPADAGKIRFFEKRNPGDCIRIRTLRSHAHPGGVLLYRIEYRDRAVVYATDTEGYANTNWRLVNFARNADLLIHDAQFTEQHYLGLFPGLASTRGWGHSTIRMACDVASSAGVKQLVLFHLDPGYDDWTIAQNEAESRRIFPDSMAAYEGLEIHLEGRSEHSHNAAVRQMSINPSIMIVPAAAGL